ncbi:hypothetical protein COM61_02310 [Bacillus toyonensis]|nr:hypothetical protein COM61_02310 [Bacillus toyonensis]
MKYERIEIPYMQNRFIVNVVYENHSTVEEGHPIMTYSRLKTLLESGNETYLTLLNRISELELELQKCKRN